jgi:hypothetical protein
MKNTSFYLGIALLFTHELDAMSNHEWRLLPGLNALSEAAGSATFLIAHVPLFAVVIAFIASLNLEIRTKARNIASGFLIVHAIAHYLFSSNAAYEFSSVVSSALIYGAGLCGLVYFLAPRLEQNSRISG